MRIIHPEVMYAIALAVAKNMKTVTFSQEKFISGQDMYHRRYEYAYMVAVRMHCIRMWPL